MSEPAGSELTLGTGLGKSLQAIMDAQDIVPGTPPSYQDAKVIYAYHPMGAKIAEFPIMMAMSDGRRVSVPKGPEEVLTEAFWRQWKTDAWDRAIFNTATLARVYGIATIALDVAGQRPNTALALDALAGKNMALKTFDPLNTAGSLVLNQDPNSPDFQRLGSVSVQGQPWHSSRTVSIMHENPVYIEYTTSAFGYVGRSVYQRALFPLKSYLNTLVTDDMVAVKAGLLVHKQKSTGSAADAVANAFAGIKRVMLKVGRTGHVLTIGDSDDITSLNLQNLDGAANMARNNIIENIAAAAAMPALILKAETFAQGFGEGTEDAKHVAQYVGRVREWMQPMYDLADRVTMRRAWTPELYKTIQADYPEYKDTSFNEAYYAWTNSFAAEWPSLLEEPDSEKIKVDDVKLKAVIALVETLAPQLDPSNKVLLFQWAADNFNALKLTFTSPLLLDYDELKDYVEDQAANQQAIMEAAGSEGDEQGVNAPPQPGRPFAAADAVTRLSEAAARLPDRRGARR